MPFRTVADLTDEWYSVSSWLHPKDVYTLVVALWRMFNPIGPSAQATNMLRWAFDTSLRRVLRVRSLRPEHFQFLCESGARLTGPLMAQVVMGIHWKLRTIDIMCMAREFHSIHGDLLSGRYGACWSTTMDPVQATIAEFTEWKAGSATGCETQAFQASYTLLSVDGHQPADVSEQYQWTRRVQLELMVFYDAVDDTTIDAKDLSELYTLGINLVSWDGCHFRVPEGRMSYLGFSSMQIPRLGSLTDFNIISHRSKYMWDGVKMRADKYRERGITLIPEGWQF
jgi:hypothetical protein